jgi:putative acetyltransferase
MSDGFDRFRIRPIESRDNGAVAQIIRDVMTEFGAVGCNSSIHDPEVDAMFAAYPGPATISSWPRV